MENHRKHKRRICQYFGRIDLGDGSPLQPCKLMDVSEGGAKLIAAKPDAIPDAFTLRLSRDGAVRRACVVVWRSEKIIGVRFMPNAGAKRTAAAVG